MATLSDLSFLTFQRESPKAIPAEMGASGQRRFGSHHLSLRRDKPETEAKLVKPTACRGFKSDNPVKTGLLPVEPSASHHLVASSTAAIDLRRLTGLPNLVVADNRLRNSSRAF